MDSRQLIKASSNILCYLVRELPAGTTVVGAKWMLKARQADADGAALVSKSVTLSSSASGQVTDDGTDGTAEVRIVVQPADLASVTQTSAWCALKVNVSSGVWVEIAASREPVRVVHAIVQANA